MKDEILRLRISQVEKEAIREIAEDKQMSMSEYVLYLIRKDIEKESSN